MKCHLLLKNLDAIFFFEKSGNGVAISLFREN